MWAVQYAELTLQDGREVILWAPNRQLGGDELREAQVVEAAPHVADTSQWKERITWSISEKRPAGRRGIVGPKEDNHRDRTLPSTGRGDDRRDEERVEAAPGKDEGARERSGAR